MAAAIPMVIGAVAGGIQGNEERKATERFNKGAAEANRFSDVTGKNIALRKDNSGGFLGGAIKGATSFGGLGGGALGGGGGAAPAPAAGAGFASGGLAQNTRQRPGGSFGGLGVA